jgi:hypothetical protein
MEERRKIQKEVVRLLMEEVDSKRAVRYVKYELAQMELDRTAKSFKSQLR